MTTLHERLADLAEDAPSALPVPGLWDRGVTYRRRRRTGTAVVLAVAALALIAIGSVTWLRSPAAVEPLPAGSPSGLPDRLYTPSRWLPGTDDAGPLGPIAALIPATRGSWAGSREGQVVGVSAVTGEYRFLDLPGLAAHAGGLHAWALSPDGAHVAYLYRASGAQVADSAATGLALYDAATGTVRFHAVPTSRGIRAYDLVWAGSSTVVLSYGTVSDEDDSLSLAQPLLAWDVHVSAPQSLTALGRRNDVRGAGPGFVVVGAGHGFLVVDPGTGTVLRRIGADLREAMTEPVFDGTHSRFAILLGNRTPHQMWVGTLSDDSDEAPSYARVPGSDRSFATYAWIDDDHLALLQRKDAGKNTLAVVVNKVDIRTGEASRIIAFDALDVGFDRQLATDLFRQPTVDAVRPPRPLDPRKVASGGLAIVLAAGWALIVWRRRVQP